ncbi:hypothetical protein Pint_06903 [Pistacia integerrima]|uniref:Uncharacterized protein n=1 Tax=Pistacia integerrima TaxID=434235 RepID=A0ACC0XX55_9ROSI|nr:hypothetical protein Pint_06903 [Pistacia integerrima]
MLLQTIILYVLIFLLSILILKTLFSFSSKHYKLPPSPFALPVVGHLHLLSPFMHHSFHMLSSRYGPLIHLRIGSVNCVVASSPEIAKELLKTNELTFSARKHTAAIDHLTYNSSFAFAPYGPYWKFIKKISTVELLGARTLGQFLPIRSQELQDFVKLLLEKSHAGERVNVTEELLKLANNVISQMMFSIKCSGTYGQAEETRRLVREVTEIFGEFNISDIIWFFKNVDLQGFRRRFMDIHKRYDSLLEKIISNREMVRTGKKKNGRRINGDVDDDEEVRDFLDILLDALENEKSEIQLTRDHIKAIILDFLTAATDTTAMAAEWALAELINNPNVLEKAQEEIDQVVGKSRLVQESDLPNLPYLQAIIKENFRLHPPIPMLARKSIEDCQIGKYTIPEGSLLFVNLWSIGRDPKVWSNPMKFNPERFLKPNESDGLETNIDVKGFSYQLLPFGTGRRGCPGINLAMQELPTTLAAMIQCFNWKVVNPEGVEIKGKDLVDMSERPGLTAPRAHDLVCVPLARCSPVS